MSGWIGGEADGRGTEWRGGCGGATAVCLRGLISEPAVCSELWIGTGDVILPEIRTKRVRKKKDGCQDAQLDLR